MGLDYIINHPDANVAAAVTQKSGLKDGSLALLLIYLNKGDETMIKQTFTLKR